MSLSRTELIARVVEEVAQRTANDKGWIHVRCPACSGPRDHARKLAVSMRTGWWRCFRVNCGWIGRLPGFEGKTVDPWAGVEDEEVEVSWETPSEYLALDDLFALEGRQYVEDRAVPEQVWRAAELGYASKGDHRGMVILPVKGIGGDLQGWVGRRVFETANLPKAHSANGMNRERVLYNAPALAGPRVVLVEGPFGALRLWPYGAACMGQPTAWQINAVAEAKRPTAVVLDGDTGSDGPGDSRAAKISRAIRRRGNPHAGAVVLPYGTQPDTYQDPRRLAHAIVRACEGVDVDLR